MINSKMNFEAPDFLNFEQNEEAPDYLTSLGPKCGRHIRTRKNHILLSRLFQVLFFSSILNGWFNLDFNVTNLE